MQVPQHIGHGTVPLPLAWGRKFHVHGGPYKNVPNDGFHRVNLLTNEEMKTVFHMVKLTQAHLRLPIHDYTTPTQAAATVLVDELVNRIIASQPVYVGCRGGKGRTGLILALLAKTFGVKDPIEYVREHYHEEAVETLAQRAFVEAFKPLDRTRDKIKQSRRHWRWKARWQLTNFS